MKYGKLENGILIPAPPVLQIEMTFEENGESFDSLQKVGNPTAAQYAAQGWLPVIESTPPEPEEGYHFEETYTEGDGEIVQSWVLVADPEPEPPEPTLEEALYKLAGGV